VTGSHDRAPLWVEEVDPNGLVTDVSVWGWVELHPGSQMGISGENVGDQRLAFRHEVNQEASWCDPAPLCTFDVHELEYTDTRFVGVATYQSATGPADARAHETTYAVARVVQHVPYVTIVAEWWFKLQCTDERVDADGQYQTDFGCTVAVDHLADPLPWANGLVEAVAKILADNLPST
jgi:hypothetical protein